MPKTEIRLRDIAAKLRVSSATVSLALHDHPRIPEHRRLEIQRMARQMGYRPNPMATALVHRKTNTRAHHIVAEIAWINYWKNSKEFHAYRELDLYWKGAVDSARSHGYNLEEFACHDRVAPARLEEILLARGIRGILIPPHRLGDLPSGWEKVHWDRFSLVRIGYSVELPRVHVVTSNHVTNGFIALENMRRLGYRRIGLVTGQSIKTPNKAGFLMKQLEINPDQRIPVLILPALENHALDWTSFNSWLKKNRPDSILTDIAILRDRLASAGLDVPRGIGLASISVLDGNADAGIDQQSKEIGKIATELLISAIHHNLCGVPPIITETLIEGKWVDGQSLPRRHQTELIEA